MSHDRKRLRLLESARRFWLIQSGSVTGSTVYLTSQSTGFVAFISRQEQCVDRASRKVVDSGPSAFTVIGEVLAQSWFMAKDRETASAGQPDVTFCWGARFLRLN